MNKTGLLSSKSYIAVIAVSVSGRPLLLLLASQKGRPQTWLFTRHPELYSHLWFSSVSIEPLASSVTVAWVRRRSKARLSSGRWMFWSADRALGFPASKRSVHMHELILHSCLSHSVFARTYRLPANRSRGWEKAGVEGRLQAAVSLSAILSRLSPKRCTRVLYGSLALLQGCKAAYPLSTPCCRKRGETQPGGGMGWLVPPKTGVLRAPSPLWLPWITCSRCPTSEQRSFSLCLRMERP